MPKLNMCTVYTHGVTNSLYYLATALKQQYLQLLLYKSSIKVASAALTTLQKQNRVKRLYHNETTAWNLNLNGDPLDESGITTVRSSSNSYNNSSVTISSTNYKYEITCQKCASNRLFHLFKDYYGNKKQIQANLGLSINKCHKLQK